MADERDDLLTRYLGGESLRLPEHPPHFYVHPEPLVHPRPVGLPCSRCRRSFDDPLHLPPQTPPAPKAVG